MLTRGFGRTMVCGTRDCAAHLLQRASNAGITRKKGGPPNSPLYQRQSVIRKEVSVLMETRLIGHYTVEAGTETETLTMMVMRYEKAHSALENHCFKSSDGVRLASQYLPYCGKRSSTFESVTVITTLKNFKLATRWWPLI